jgi:amino acid transporter
VEIFSAWLLFLPCNDAMAGVLEESSTKTGSRCIVQNVQDVEDRHFTPQPGPSSAAIPDVGRMVTQYERQSLIRGLGQRHIQMIAIAGAIVCIPL